VSLLSSAPRRRWLPLCERSVGASSPCLNGRGTRAASLMEPQNQPPQYGQPQNPPSSVPPQGQPPQYPPSSPYQQPYNAYPPSSPYQQPYTAPPPQQQMPMGIGMQPHVLVPAAAALLV